MSDPNTEAASYMEDDPKAWAEWIDALERYVPELPALAKHLGDETGAIQIIGGSILAYLADRRGLYLRRDHPAIEADLLAQIEKAVLAIPDDRERVGGEFGYIGKSAVLAAIRSAAPGARHDNGEPCWFCGRNVGIDYLIAGYDTFEEQRLACLDCDRAIKALYEKGWLPGARHDVPDLDEAWAETEAALIAAQGDDDGFGVEIAYWEEFPESPWAVAANDVQVEAARLPEALRNLAAILRPPVLVPRDDPTREDIEG